MTNLSTFKTCEGETAFLKAYDAAMNMWPVPYEEIEISTQFGLTHVVISGPKDAPPLVLLHGMSMTLTMWLPNVADFCKDYRVYAIDIMGQPGKSVPNYNEPIRDVADFMVWLSEIIDKLNLDSIYLVGMSNGGWLGLNFAITAPERVRKLVLLSPGGCFEPLSMQFRLRGMLMTFFTTRLTTESFLGWTGIKDTTGDLVSRSLLDLFYLGMKHFRMPPETAFVLPVVTSDEELQALKVPVLLLIGDNEVVYNSAKALERAKRLIPNLEGELVPESNHNMCGSHYPIVDARVLEFLKDN